MIELNLLEKKEPFKLPVMLGVDLNNLNFIMIGVAIFIYYVPEIFIRSSFEDKIKVEEESLAKITAETSKLTSESLKDNQVKTQLEAYNNQVEKLKVRSAQVDEILKIRTNPKKILEKIARSIPDDLWFDQLKINENRDVLIIGGAYSPRSIGEFINNINESPYFGSSITPVKQENKKETIDGQTISYESFELKGKVKNYDMRSK